jgi:hypothetical protein
MANGKEQAKQQILNGVPTLRRQPALYPRFVLAVAMTVFSFATIERTAGLNPMKMWCGTEAKLIRAKDQAVKYYENIRFAYQLQRQLKDLHEQQGLCASSAHQNLAP